MVPYSYTFSTLRATPGGLSEQEHLIWVHVSNDGDGQAAGTVVPLGKVGHLHALAQSTH